MTKKNDKRLCWNCEGNVSHHLAQCPYCGVDLTQPAAREESSFKGFGTPFQSAPRSDIPQSPYERSQTKDFAVTVTEEEWNSTLNAGKEHPKQADASLTAKKEMMAFLLLLPGIVFFLFGLALIFFSNEGILTLRWNQDVAYFYFLGAFPLLYLGWRACRGKVK
jgi:hypothetical protein